jgi:cysteine-rich repeat protein
VVDPALGETCDAGPDNSNAANAPCRVYCQPPRCGDGAIDTDLGEVCDDGDTEGGDGCSADCRSLEVCGNGVVDVIRGELCDSGAANANVEGAPCREDCLLPRCGDEVVDPGLGETCDAGAANKNEPDAPCRIFCQPPRCGDGVRDPGLGEVCDVGDTVSGDGCSSDCRSDETCGNGIIDVAAGEQCDEAAANADAPDAPCRADCRLPRCGDGVADPRFGEACDLGDANSDAANAGCRTSCQLPRCGDDVVDTALGEVCDVGDTVSGDGCSADCRSDETCGNGVVDVARGEQCDENDANADEPDAPCRLDCRLPRCGDGITDPDRGEGCDLGAANSNGPGAACRLTCQPARCGDGILDAAAGEVCDLGDTVSGDGCSADCRSLEVCGNGIVDLVDGEQCDAGPANGDAEDGPCRGNCQLPRCGDGVVDRLRGEGCDAGAGNSDAAGAACRTNCQPSRCGDGIEDGVEVCDDGNTVSGDWCSGDCRSDEVCGNGYVDFARLEQCDDANATQADFCHNDCSLPRCGDGILDFNEACDAGAGNGDYADAPCRANCQLPRCGDGFRDSAYGEVCDDGNLVANDGCRPDCLSNETCGNGVVDPAKGENCDDGNLLARDGCSACEVEEVVVLTPRLTPPARSAPHLAYDPIRQRVVLFGGDNGSPLSDTWEWDGSGWLQLKPAVSPPARSAGAMVYDAARRRIVLFGGFGGGGGVRRDTWEWDGVRWVDRTPSNTTLSPSGRARVAAAFDAGLGEVVLYGGVSSGTGAPLQDTWSWDGTRWIRRAELGVPTAGVGPSMAYHVGDEELLLWGGEEGDKVMYRWVRSRDEWQPLGVYPGVPQGARLPLVYDPARQRVVLVPPTGEFTWEWTKLGWQAISGGEKQPAAVNAAAAYDAARQQLVLLAGATTALRTDDRWDGATPASAPAARSGAAIAYDALGGRTVLVGGGTSGAWGGLYGDLWTWDGRRWREVEPGGSAWPRPQANATLAYDPANRRLLLAGGLATEQVAESVWIYDGAGWSEDIARQPGYRNSAIAFDTSRGELMVFGGGLQSSVTSELWTWTPGFWASLGSAPFSGRRNSSLSYDPRRGIAVLFGGKKGVGIDPLPSETWEYDGQGWALVTSRGPAGRYAASMTYNPDARVTALFGNAPGGSEELWEWDGIEWQQRTLDTTLTSRYRSAVAYDAARHQLVVFGGRDGAGSVSDDTRLIQYRPNVAVEACTYELDYDGDTLAGCDDPDCWGQCTPLCPPGADPGCASSTPSCGDGECLGVESCGLCPEDCGACPGALCGDFVCDGSESAVSCPSDCAP